MIILQFGLTDSLLIDDMSFIICSASTSIPTSNDLHYMQYTVHQCRLYAAQ